jgi:hypothetical protein
MTGKRREDGRACGCDQHDVSCVDLLVGLTVGAWLGSLMALVAALAAGWRLRFHPSASAVAWRRQATAQRRTAGALQPWSSGRPSYTTSPCRDGRPAWSTW